MKGLNVIDNSFLVNIILTNFNDVVYSCSVMFYQTFELDIWVYLNCSD